MISISDIKEKFAHGSLGNGVHQTQSMKQQEWDNLFAGIDKDGDGKISFHEFQAHMLDMLKKEPNFRYEHSSGTASTAFTAGSGPGTTMMSSGLSSQLTGFKSGGTNFSYSFLK